MLFGTPRKCLGERSRECPGNWERPREHPGSAFPHSLTRESTLGSTPWHSQFPVHSREHSARHFLGVPKKHSESTRRSTFGEYPESTSVNGRRDLPPPLFLQSERAKGVESLWASCGETVVQKNNAHITKQSAVPQVLPSPTGSVWDLGGGGVARWESESESRSYLCLA